LKQYCFEMQYTKFHSYWSIVPRLGAGRRSGWTYYFYKLFFRGLLIRLDNASFVTMTTWFYPSPQSLGVLVTGCGPVGRCPILSEEHPLAFSSAKTVVFELVVLPDSCSICCSSCTPFKLKKWVFWSKIVCPQSEFRWRKMLVHHHHWSYFSKKLIAPDLQFTILDEEKL